MPRFLLMIFVLLAVAAAGFLASPWLAPQAERVWRRVPEPYRPERPTGRLSAATPVPVPPEVPGSALPPRGLPPASAESSSPPASRPADPMPEKFYPDGRMKMTSLFNGMRMRTRISTEQGDPASLERKEDDSYLLDFALNIQIPRPATSLEDVRSIVPGLESALPSLPSLLESAQVSPVYHSLYQRKVNLTEQRATVFHQLLSRHNFFDCDTILELTAQPSGRDALLILADMDVVTDGSDPDRTLEYDASSPTFQPWTNYSWARRQREPESPFIAPRQAEIAKLKAVQADPRSSEHQKKEAFYRIARLNQEIEALRYRSSLVASLDPFIVLPAFAFNDPNRQHLPQIGDYAIVIHGNRAYPAIVGDKGPNAKIGEASTLLCQAIRPGSGGNSRAVSNLDVAYLVFPGTADPQAGPPDLRKWHARCLELAHELGGLGVPLHDWAPPPAAPATAAPPGQPTSEGAPPQAQTSPN